MTAALTTAKMLQSNQNTRSRSWVSILKLPFSFAAFNAAAGRTAPSFPPPTPLLATAASGDPYTLSNPLYLLFPNAAHGRLASPGFRQVEVPVRRAGSFSAFRPEDGSASPGVGLRLAGNGVYGGRPAFPGRLRNRIPAIGPRAAGCPCLPASSRKGGAPTTKACSTAFRIPSGSLKEVPVA